MELSLENIVIGGLCAEYLGMLVIKMQVIW